MINSEKTMPTNYYRMAQPIAMELVPAILDYMKKAKLIAVIVGNEDQYHS